MTSQDELVVQQLNDLLAQAEYLLALEVPVTGSAVPAPTAQGDMLAASAVDVWALLAIGTQRQLLTVNGGGTGPGWESFNWGNLAGAAGADMAHAHSSAATGGQLDHGGLAGLGDDDHAQYLLRAVLTTKGDIFGATGAAAVTRLGVGVDGLVLTADSGEATGLKWAAATSAIFDAVAPTTIQPDDAAAAGAAVFAARRDHVHGIVAAAPSNIGVANAEGTGTSFVRNDHVHNHPSGLGANLHHNQLHASAHEVGGGDLVGHDNLTGFVTNEHINHAGVSIGVSGLGLSGGGTIAASRTITLASSSNPGVAAAILASDASGLLQLQGLGLRAALGVNAAALYVPWISGDAKATAVFGSSNINNDDNAIEGRSYNGKGVWGESSADYGVYGKSVTNHGVYGVSTTGDGIHGVTGAGAFSGVYGENTASNIGVQGVSSGGPGVKGISVTGIAGYFNLTGAGTEILRCDDNGTPVFVVDDGGNVGIGTTAPASMLEVEENLGTNVTAAATTYLTIGKIRSYVGSGDLTGDAVQLDFQNGDRDGNDEIRARIKVEFEGTGRIYTRGTSLSFWTKPSEIALSQAMTINSTGNVGIGTTSPSTRLDIDAGAMEFAEMTAPAAGAANTARLFAQDNGAGKTQLCVRFNSGAIQVLATEP